jgi:hypothetical protein
VLQCLDLEDLRSKISPDREVDPESEQCAGNEVSIIALMSMKFRTLGSPKCQLQGTQVDRHG